jgi:hypothetical protein
MRKRLPILAALILPIVSNSLQTIAQEKPASMPKDTEYVGRLNEDARQAMAKECQNDDKAKKQACMKEFLSKELGVPASSITID